MKKIRLIKNKLIMTFLLSITALSYSGTPLWTLTPLTATTLLVASNNTETVQYTVTNTSRRVHTLSMQSIIGIAQTTTGSGVCGNPFILPPNASCTLSLQVNGSQISASINDGPIICEQGSTLQCYRPAPSNILHITQTPAITIDTVSPSIGSASSGTGVTITGTGFTGATSLTFGGIEATSLNVVSSTRVTAVTPARAQGALAVTPNTVDVVITTPSGSAMKTNAFTQETTTIGQAAYGGTIACLNGGLNNLIASTYDNTSSSAGIIWGQMDVPTNSRSTTNGATNTAQIVDCLTNITSEVCPGNMGITAYAAGICSNYEVDSQGNTPCQSGNTCYNDWFLPAGNNTTSSGQLYCLYTNQVAIGNFDSSVFYWSSTEFDASNSYALYFYDGVSGYLPNNIETFVRCVRNFIP